MRLDCYIIKIIKLSKAVRALRTLGERERERERKRDGVLEEKKWKEKKTKFWRVDYVWALEIAGK